MALVEACANPEWVREMTRCLIAIARVMHFFTADDVFRLAGDAGMVATTRDRRAFGPIMLRAARDRVCCKANRLPVNSERKSLHSSPIQVWQSLIYDGKDQEPCGG